MCNCNGMNFTYLFREILMQFFSCLVLTLGSPTLGGVEFVLYYGLFFMCIHHSFGETHDSWSTISIMRFFEHPKDYGVPRLLFNLACQTGGALIFGWLSFVLVDQGINSAPQRLDSGDDVRAFLLTFAQVSIFTYMFMHMERQRAESVATRKPHASEFFSLKLGLLTAASMYFQQTYTPKATGSINIDVGRQMAAYWYDTEYDFEWVNFFLTFALAPFLACVASYGIVKVVEDKILPGLTCCKKSEKPDEPEPMDLIQETASKDAKKKDDLTV